MVPETYMPCSLYHKRIGVCAPRKLGNTARKPYGTRNIYAVFIVPPIRRFGKGEVAAGGQAAKFYRMTRFDLRFYRGYAILEAVSTRFARHPEQSPAETAPFSLRLRDFARTPYFGAFAECTH